MNRIIYWIQEKLTVLSAHPYTMIVTFLFLISWFIIGYLKPSFDPAFGVGNLLVNSAGLLLLFAACSLGARHVDTVNTKFDKIHNHLDKVHVHVLDLHEKLEERDK